jgi:hypothetical protein
VLENAEVHGQQHWAEAIEEKATIKRSAAKIWAEAR